MPWTPKDAYRHTHKAKSPKAQRQWSHVADSALSRGSSEGSAIRQANAVVARNHAAGGSISPLASVVGNPMTMRATLPHLGQPSGMGGRMRMPHVPLADTMHNIDQHMTGARVKLPQLKAQLAHGGTVPTLGVHGVTAVKNALTHLTNRDASSASATLRASREAMQHPVVRQAAQDLRTAHGISGAYQSLSELAGTTPP